MAQHQQSQMTRVSAESAVPLVRVFVSCPGDLDVQRQVVKQAVAEVQADREYAGKVQLEVYAYEHLVPARVGMSAQDVVNAYMLRPDACELFICMLAQRMGTPQTLFINPLTSQPYQSGTEYEFLTAYAAAQRLGLPVVLLYRAQRPALPPTATDEERVQFARVQAFFDRFTGGRRPQRAVSAVSR